MVSDAVFYVKLQRKLLHKIYETGAQSGYLFCTILSKILLSVRMRRLNQTPLERCKLVNQTLIVSIANLSFMLHGLLFEKGDPGAPGTTGTGGGVGALTGEKETYIVGSYRIMYGNLNASNNLLPMLNFP